MGLNNHPAAETDILIINNARLAGREAGLRFGENYFGAVIF